MNKHPHCELIKVWAEGAKIQFYDPWLQEWQDCPENNPSWFPETKYRVKAEPRTPQQIFEEAMAYQTNDSYNIRFDRALKAIIDAVKSGEIK